MEKLKFRKNAYIEGSKVGFVVGAFVAIATARFITQMRKDFNAKRYPFSAPR